MKKIITFFVCICLLAASLAGCGMEDALVADSKANKETTAPATQDEAKDEVKADSFDNTLDGLSKYFIAKEYISVDKNGKPVETKMDAGLIGASEGKKFASTYGGKPVTIELYVYDAKNLNDLAKKMIDSVKKDGTFTIESEYNGSKIEMPAVPAYISDNGMYMMVYTDTSIDAKNPKTDSDNYIQREKVIEDFKAFHK